MNIYYVDSLAGLNENDGLSEEKPKKDWTGLDLRPGDTVRLSRGSTWNMKIDSPSGDEGNPVVWEAYGDGDKPVVSGAVTLQKDLWKKESGNVWVYDAPLPSEVGNVIFDGGESFGTFRWEKEELAAQGDFFDSGSGRTERPKLPRRAEDRLFVWSEADPGEFYEKIECAVFGGRVLATAKAHVVMRDLCFYGSGVHGFAADAPEDILLENCDFSCIGGMAWDRPQHIRFGNGFECWMGCRRITIRGCTFRNIYDSCFTHQGFLPFPVPEDILVENCTFDTYGMAAFEIRDQVPLREVLRNNVMMNAGMGFAMQGETLPRRSEIWPQPMGHHIFLWRIEAPTPGGSVAVKDSVFGPAPNGSAVYSIIDPAAEAQFGFAGNDMTACGEQPVHLTGNALHGFVD